MAFTHIRLQKRRIDRCAISSIRQQTRQELNTDTDQCLNWTEREPVLGIALL